MSLCRWPEAAKLISATDALQLLLHGDGECAIVRLEGELGAISVPFVRDVIEQLLAATVSSECIEIHIENLERCDAAGFDLLTQLERSALRLDRRLVVVKARP